MTVLPEPGTPPKIRPTGEGNGVLPVYAAVAAFLIALPCWRLLLRLHPHPRFWSGFLTGPLITLPSYLLTGTSWATG